MITPAIAVTTPASRMMIQKLTWIPGIASDVVEPTWKLTSEKRSEPNQPSV